jgi:HSP20 family protein
MMILRRGRGVHQAGSILDIELTYEGGTTRGRRAEFLDPWRPPTEVFECGDGLVVRVEIAGLALDDLDVVVEGEALRVRGERTVGYPSGPRLYHESRIRYGPFEAEVRLPFPVAVGDASAAYVDGLLTIHLPRRAATKVAMRDDTHEQEPERGER